MTNLILLPILVPLISGIILIFFVKNIRLQEWLSTFFLLTTVVSAVFVLVKVKSEGIQTLNLGGWEAPFGITLVSDMFSALLVLTASIIAFASIIYSFWSIEEQRKKYYYYAFFQFLLVGVNGAFTTGDIFNLFVFFEVMLMSSYVLLVLGGTKIQLRESIKYILVNIVSSALFIVAVAYLYSVVGTLNMAHISSRVAEINQPGVVTVISILFLVVFGLKGAIFPLFFWLPGSYYAPPAPVMAIFGALLTKVGIYSIMRTFTLLFPHDTSYTRPVLTVLAILTIIAGVIGAIAYWDIKKIMIYNIIIAVGVITFGISVMSYDSLAGSVFYLIHDMNIKAALFLLIGIIIKITGTSNLRKFGGLITKYPCLGWTYFLAALTVAGIPPFSGFIGKIMIVRAGFEEGHNWGSAIILASSLFVLFSVMKIFINGFWGEAKDEPNLGKHQLKQLMIAPVLLVVLAIIFGLGIEAVQPYIAQAAETLNNPNIYINAVLKE